MLDTMAGFAVRYSTLTVTTGAHANTDDVVVRITRKPTQTLQEMQSVCDSTPTNLSFAYVYAQRPI